MKTFAILLLLASGAAFGEAPDNRPPDNRPPVKSTPSTAESAATSTATASTGDITINTGSDHPPGDVRVINESGPTNLAVDGDRTDFESNSFFFSANRSLPMASGCWGSYDGGGTGGRDSKFFGGFLGLQILNKDCFMDALAEKEMEAEVRALLKCESKRFRNAIGYKLKASGAKRADIQEHCVVYMTEKYLAEIQWEKEAILAQIESDKDVLREVPEVTDSLGK